MHPNGDETPNNDFTTSRPVSSFVETVRKVILDPSEFFSGVETTTAAKGPVIFAVACGMISALLGVLSEPLDPTIPSDASILQGFLSFAANNPGIAVALLVLGLILLPLFALLGLYVTAVIQHLFVLIFVRQRRGFEATFRVAAYGSAISLFSWIPIVGYLVTLYGVYVYTMGLKKLHSTSTTRALLAALVPILLNLSFTVLSFFTSG